MSDRFVTHPKRKARQERAKERQEARDKRTIEEQLALIKERRGNSCKEKWRLTGKVTD